MLPDEVTVNLSEDVTIRVYYICNKYNITPEVAIEQLIDIGYIQVVSNNYAKRKFELMLEAVKENERESAENAT